MALGGPDLAHDRRFCDLGPLIVRIDGAERSPGGPRPTAALALLLINANRRVSADALREAMWGESTGSHAASTLDTHLFRLRKVVEPDRRAGSPPSVVISEPGGYRLIAAPDQVDSIRFAQLAADTIELLRTGQPERARRKSEEALALWRGLPFQPVADEMWAAPEVTRLVEVHAQLQEGHLQALLDCGEPEEALRELEPLLARHPLRERLWAHRMLAAYRCGRVDDALATFQRARRRLRDDLGVEPGPDLRDLQTAILSGDDDRLCRRPQQAPPAAAGAVAPPVNLPRRAGPLYGRERELERLLELCGRVPLVTLTGAGGCGKTRLAIEVAQGMTGEFVDGVHFIDLTVVQASDQVADAVVSTLGLAPASAGRSADLLRAFVRDRRMLLILDNCEHVIDGAAELVDALLVPGSELSVLATSREPLQVDGEFVVALGPLPLPDSDDGSPDRSAGDPLGHPADGLAAIADNPSVRLFLARSGYQIDPENGAEELALVSRICRSVDGVPLALELAAGRARAYSLTEIARQVAGDPAGLGAVRRGAPAHQRSVGLAVEWSYRLLTTTEQLVHRRISVIAGPFTTATAAQVTGLGAGEIESTLVALVSKSMVVPLGPARPDGPSQFAQLATIRAHGRNELLARHESPAADRMRDQWVVDLIAAKPRAGHRDERAWFKTVEDDFAAVRATLHDTLRQRRDPAGVFVAGRLTMFWYFHGRVPEGGRWCALAREVTGATPLDQVLVLLGKAGEWGLAQRMDLATPLIEEGLRIAAARGPDEDILFGEALLQVAGAAMLAGDQMTAADLAGTALQIAERNDDRLLALTARARLALNPQGPQADSAPEVYLEAVEHDNHFAAYLAANAAMMRAFVRGDPATALHWSDRIIEVNRRHDIGQAPSLLEIRANLLTMLGEPVEAVKLYSAARFHNSRAGLPWPSWELTTGLLARATDQVDRTRFEDAWQAGRHLTLADIDLAADDFSRSPH